MAEKEIRARKKKKLGSYPSLSVIFSISLSLFVIGLFGLLMLHANNLTQIIKENIEVQVYLNKDISQNQKIQVLKTISTKSYVRKNNDQADVSFVSKEEAASQFIEETGEDFRDFLGENPLRDAYIIKVNPEFQTSTQLNTIKKELEQLSGVFEVVFVENLVDSINENLTKVGLVLLGFSVILVLVVVILINNTIKLALFSQRFLIRSMQLVGAKSGFIRRPFLSRSFLYGILGGVVASILLQIVMNAANNKIEDLSTLQQTDQIALLYAFLLLIGGFIGFLSTYRAINKYLKLSLDELY